jgi:hypothetical protein
MIQMPRPEGSHFDDKLGSEEKMHENVESTVAHIGLLKLGLGARLAIVLVALAILCLPGHYLEIK